MKMTQSIDNKIFIRRGRCVVVVEKFDFLLNPCCDAPNQKDGKTDGTDEPDLNGLFFSGFFKKSV